MRARMLLAAMALLVLAPAVGAQQAPQPAAASPVCAADDWASFFRALRRAASLGLARIDVALPDVDSTGARKVPDAGPQRLRLDTQLTADQSVRVWLYPGLDRLRFVGLQATPDAGDSPQRPAPPPRGEAPGIDEPPMGIAISRSVPRQVTEAGMQATDITVSVPSLGTIGHGAIAWRLGLEGDATFVVVVCNTKTGAAVSYGTREARIAGGWAATLYTILIIVLVYWLAGYMAAEGRRSGVAPGDMLQSDTGWQAWHPVVITQDASGRGSLSRLQIGFFTLIVLATLSYVFLRSGVVANISEDVLWLLGIAGLGSAAAQLVGTRRAPSTQLPYGVIAWFATRGQMIRRRSPQWRDLFFTGGEFDIFRLQNLVFSPFVGLTVLMAGFTELASLSIPPNLLLLLGLTQGLYVGGKGVATTVSPPELEAAVGAADAAEARLRVAWRAAGLGAWTADRNRPEVAAEVSEWNAKASAASDRFARIQDDDTLAVPPTPIL